MKNIGFAAWAKPVAALVTASLMLTGCRSPRKPPPVEPSSAIQTRRQAMEGAPDQVTAQGPTIPVAECTLSMILDDSQMDCTFQRCPRAFLAELLGSQSAFLERVREKHWRIRAGNDTPPFLPESRMVLVSKTEGWTIEQGNPGETPSPPLGTCRFAGEDRLSDASERTIVVRALTLRRQMGAR
jgi:hypothetical protein